jgi:hypothetical protein
MTARLYMYDLTAVFTFDANYLQWYDISLSLNIEPSGTTLLLSYADDQVQIESFVGDLVDDNFDFPIYLGAEVIGDEIFDNFNGFIYDFHLYNYARAEL